MSIYEKLFGANVEECEALMASTKALVPRGKYKEAEERLKKAIQIAPSYGKPHCYLGNLYERMKRDKDAIKEYEIAIQLEPNQAEYHYQLATVFFRRKQYAEAERELRRTVELDPATADGHVGLGTLLMEEKKYPEAERELRRAIEINPADAQPHRNLSAVLYDTDRIEEALHELEAAVAIFEKDGQTQMVRQLDLYVRGMRAKVKQRESARLRKEPKPARAHAIGDWNEDRSTAVRVLNELYEIYTDRSVPEKKKMQQLTAVINKNGRIIYEMQEFSELLESEIEKTMQDGPAIMAMQYLEIRWLLTGKEEHRREMEEYSKKVEKMDFRELTGMD